MRRTTIKSIQRVSAVLLAWFVVHLLETSNGPREMRAPHAIGLYGERADPPAEIEGAWDLFLRPEGDARRDMAYFDLVNARDALGIYTLDATQFVNGAKVYRSINSGDLLLWYAPQNNGWYVGPPDRLGTGKGILQAPGNARGPSQRGWTIGQRDGGWYKIGLEAMTTEEMLATIAGGARRISADWPTKGSTYVYDDTVLFGRPQYRCEATGGNEQGSPDGGA